MSEEYQTEEEQIAAIKRWWKENGKSIILGLVLGIGGISGYRYWQGTVVEQAQLASTSFSEVVSLSGSSKKEFLDKVSEVQTQYAGQSYADLSAFVAAKNLIDKKDYAAAKEQLKWIIANSQYDSFVHIAKIRLAKVMLQLGEAEAALELVKDETSSGFESIYAELRGDIHASLKLYVKAKADYQLALNKISIGDRRSVAIEMKTNNLPATDSPTNSIVKD